MSDYTGWECKKCKSHNYQNSVEGVRCTDCFNPCVYLRNGKRLPRHEEHDAMLVRLGLRSANPFR